MSAKPMPESDSAAPGIIGQTLRGTYRVVEILDQGGMGTVAVAEHLRLKRRVAVKVLAAHLATDENALLRFQREAEIISQLHHPNIVQVIDFDTTELGEPYLVMELLEGESLAAYLERVGRVPLAEVDRLLGQIAAGLGAAHAAGIVHRDLKPGNIFLVNVPNQPSFAKLLDFGISKNTSKAVRAKVTREFDVLGTPDYMPPEQALGRTANVDHRGDQYSLAAICYELLSGRVPFQGDTVMDVLYQVAHEQAPAVSSVAPHVPASLDDVLQKAMSKSPKERYESIADFANAFSQAASQAKRMSESPTVAVPNGNSGHDFSPVSYRPTTPAPAPDESDRVSDVHVVNEANLATPSVPSISEAPASGVAPSGSYGATQPSAVAEQVSSVIKQARQAHDFGETDLALQLADKVLRLANGADGEVSKIVKNAATLLDTIFEASLGGLDRRLVIKRIPTSTDSFTPEQVFLISRLDGGYTVEEALDVSPFPRTETLRLIVGCVQRKLVEVE